MLLLYKGQARIISKYTSRLSVSSQSICGWFFLINQRESTYNLMAKIGLSLFCIFGWGSIQNIPQKVDYDQWTWLLHLLEALFNKFGVAFKWMWYGLWKYKFSIIKKTIYFTYYRHLFWDFYIKVATRSQMIRAVK